MSGSVRKSVANEKTVHGVVVRRLPIGAYLRAVESIRELPANLLERLFPGTSADEALARLKQLRAETLLTVIGRGAAALPEEFLGFFGALLSVPAEQLRDGLTPTEFMDVLTEFWKLNDLSNFIKRVREAAGMLK